jgi:hypothetical protein
MSVLRQIRAAIQNRILGETILPEEFATGIADPQQEITPPPAPILFLLQLHLKDGPLHRESFAASA